MKVIKKIMMICSLMVLQVYSAEGEQDLKLVTSQRIAKALMRLRADSQTHCDCVDKLAQPVHFLTKADDDILWFVDNFNLDVMFAEKDCDRLRPYINFMHDMRAKLEHFYSSFQECSAAEKLAFSPFDYYSKEGWGDCTNPTIPPKTTNFCTYLYSLFKTPVGNYESVSVAINDIVRTLKNLQTILRIKKNHCSSLNRATAGIGEGANSFVQTYEKMISGYTPIYKKAIAPIVGLLVGTLWQLKEVAEKASRFSAEEKMLQQAIQIQSERFMQEGLNPYPF